MTAGDVVELLRTFDQNQIGVWLDGGWGVDALLGRRTRPHGDLDILLQQSDVPGLRELLGELGYADVPRDDTRECNFVLGDARGREVDVHAFAFDAAGDWVYDRVTYPSEALGGTGRVRGYAVRCVSPEWAVKFHSGYEVDEEDYQDVLALCRRFRLEVPHDFDKFR